MKTNGPKPVDPTVQREENAVLIQAPFVPPSSRMPHNIDLHAVTGPGGDAASPFTAPVGMHVANGMYGV